MIAGETPVAPTAGPLAVEQRTWLFTRGPGEMRTSGKAAGNKGNRRGG